MVIPARVIRNWDMEPRLVSRAAAQLLMLLEDRSVLPLEELNPKLFTLVPDLSLVKVSLDCFILRTIVIDVKNVRLLKKIYIMSRFFIKIIQRYNI